MFKQPLDISLLKYLRSKVPNIYNKDELSQIILDYSRAINTPLGVDPEVFIDYYIKKGQVFVIELSGTKRQLIRYSLHQPSPLELGQVLKKGSYFSYETAAWLHGLISPNSLLYYLSSEVSESHSKGWKLEQHTIDSAFNKKQRKSGNVYSWSNFNFLLTSGLDTGGLGIEKKNDIYFTNIERTLLDLTVRPSYGGGAKNVLYAYRKALPYISVEKLISMLDKIGFIYPFHQSIGFYLSMAGYNGVEIQELHSRNKKLCFYLDYEMQNPLYSHDWNLFYPVDI